MAERGPPPVPGSAPLPVPQAFPPRARRRRRRRLPHLAATLALLVAPVGVAAAAYLGLADDGDSRGTPTPPLAAGPPPARELVEQTEPRVPREPGPLVQGEPVPGIPLTGVDAFHVRLRRPPRAGLVFDLDSGDVLWRRRPLRVLPMASLTKIMTALIVVARARPDEPVRITPAALRYTGSGVGLLPRGRRVRLETLVNGLLLVSGNDAAIALAQHDAGNVDAFVKRMNQQAVRMGLTCTRFTSPHGLQDEGNYSCPLDLAALARADLAERRIRAIARTERARLPFPIKGGFLDLYNNNPFIQNGTPGMTGLKTGYTEAAGRCYVMTRKVAGRHLGVVLLDAPHPIPQITDLWEAAAAL
jgi:serine-type D-Ala-D-Ala carboxypeptidase (penicillin-binding protein 5/6)